MIRVHLIITVALLATGGSFGRSNQWRRRRSPLRIVRKIRLKLHGLHRQNEASKNSMVCIFN
jgi:hypothetical protein